LFAKWSNLTVGQAKAISRSTGAGTLGIILFLIFDPKSFISFSKLGKYTSRELGLLLLSGTLTGLVASSILIAILGDDASLDEEKPKSFMREEMDAFSVSFLEPHIDIKRIKSPNSYRYNEDLIFGIDLFKVNF